jgi:protein PhnA
MFFCEFQVRNCHSYEAFKKEFENNSYKLELTITNGGNEIMVDLPNCPKCNSEYTYENEGLFICPECAHEWTLGVETENSEDKKIVKDANGNVLNDGDSVTIIKDLKVKGSSSSIKIGTKVKNIRLVDGDHNIDCRIDGFGAMSLKSEFVKKI